MEQCSRLVLLDVDGTLVAPMGDMPAIFPAPAGGMTFEKVAPMKAFYGQDTAFLMGGGLFTVTPDLPANCRKLVEMLSKD